MNKYQLLSARTLNGLQVKPIEAELRLVNMVLGLAGESGEIADMVKKTVYHKHELDLGELVDELGDLLWYVAAICTLFNIDMDKVMERNIEKLKARYPEGFTFEDNINRQ